MFALQSFVIIDGRRLSQEVAAGIGVFKLYALDSVLEGMNTPTKAKVEAAMKGHIIAQSELMGTYKK